jgi:hypothetical protein
MNAAGTARAHKPSWATGAYYTRVMHVGGAPVKPIGYFFLGIPAGALWMALWMHAHLQRAAKQLKEATELYHRAQEIYRVIGGPVKKEGAPR